MFNEYFGVIVGTWYQNVQIDKRRMLTLQIISYLLRSTCHYQVQVIFPSLGTTSKAFRFAWCKKIRSLTFTMMGTVESEANLGDMSRVYLICISFCLHFVWLLRNCDIFLSYLSFLVVEAGLRWHCKSLFHTSFHFLFSGGMIVVVMREEYLHIPEYSDSLEPLMKQLQNEGLWMCIEKSVVHKYFCDKHGVIFRYRVLHRHLWEPRDIVI